MTESFHIPSQVIDRAAYERCRLDGRTPDAVLRPRTEEECVAVVRWAASERHALVPWGGGTSMAQGNALRADRWAAVLTDALSGVTEYSPQDMVITCGAGTQLAELQSKLAGSRQYLPLDPPGSDRATLGGIVAANAHGLWRPIFGIPRDRLLALRAVMADGSAISGGAKVVKNVAGYDLCKLFAGSCGTLGLITEVTFKTSALTEARVHRTFAARSLEQAAAAALAVHTARLEPAYLVVSLIGRPALSVGLIGGAEATAWQECEIARSVLEVGLTADVDGPDEDSLRHAHDASSAHARLTMRPTEVPELLVSVECLARSVPLSVTASVGIGIVDVSFASDVLPQGEGVPGALRAMLPRSGHLTWPRAPREWRISDVWGAARGDFALIKRMKETLDPAGLFSPGRFVGRL